MQKGKQPENSGEVEQFYMGAGFDALRTTYEAFIMFDLVGSVVQRFDERISSDRLKSIFIDEGMRDEMIESIGRLYRYIPSHLHSDTYAGIKPTSAILVEEIQPV